MNSWFNGLICVVCCWFSIGCSQNLPKESVLFNGQYPDSIINLTYVFGTSFYLVENGLNKAYKVEYDPLTQISTISKSATGEEVISGQFIKDQLYFYCQNLIGKSFQISALKIDSNKLYGLFDREIQWDSMNVCLQDSAFTLWQSSEKKGRLSLKPDRFYFKKFADQYFAKANYSELATPMIGYRTEIVNTGEGFVLERAIGTAGELIETATFQQNPTKITVYFKLPGFYEVLVISPTGDIIYRQECIGLVHEITSFKVQYGDYVLMAKNLRTGVYHGKQMSLKQPSN